MHDGTIGRRIGLGLLLGLPAAVLAHVAVFGNEHVIGGTQHGSLLTATFVAAAAALAALAFAALRCARSVATGSVLSACLRPTLPSAAGLFAASALWFAGIESFEAPHAIPGLLAASVLAAVSLAIVAASHWFVRALAAVALTLFAPPSARRTPLALLRRAARTVRLRPAGERCYLFSRPPPRPPFGFPGILGAQIRGA